MSARWPGSLCGALLRVASLRGFRHRYVDMTKELYRKAGATATGGSRSCARCDCRRASSPDFVHLSRRAARCFQPIAAPGLDPIHAWLLDAKAQAHRQPGGLEQRGVPARVPCAHEKALLLRTSANRAARLRLRSPRAYTRVCNARVCILAVLFVSGQHRLFARRCAR
jgi:hypothetical protein